MGCIMTDNPITYEGCSLRNLIPLALLESVAVNYDPRCLQIKTLTLWQKATKIKE